MIRLYNWKIIRKIFQINLCDSGANIDCTGEKESASKKKV